MTRKLWNGAAILAVVIGTAAFAGTLRSDAAATPSRAMPLRASSSDLETVVFAGGCFWGVQAVFQHVEGVEVATSGYAGGSAETASYNMTSTGRTGHAESVRLEFDPARVSLEQLLEVFFTVAHDPTQLNRQGPDVGPQYRSAVWTTSDAQAAEVRAYIDRLGETGQYSREIVTEVAPLDEFYLAEAYHQDYLINHPYSPYIRIHDMPKLKHLERDFPNLWRDGSAPWQMAAAD